jgi:phenylacetate-CoA ligase
MEAWTPERVRAWQWERLRGLLRHAHAHVPYWREVLDGLGAAPDDFRTDEDLRRLPPMTKGLINERAEALTARERGAGAGPVRPRSTGGSTGENLWFLLDRETSDRRRAAGRLTELWDGVVPGTRTATIWGAALDARPSLASRVLDRLTGRLFLSAYGVSDDKLEEYLRRLERFRPEVIVSYPSILLHLARRAGADRCRRLGVRLLYTSSEALYEPVRGELEELFGAPVRNRYACREFGMVASDCPDGGGLHVCDMRLWVEIEQPSEPASPGELLITDLDNRTMPFVRYRVGDRARGADDGHGCGRPWSRLAEVEGRSLDVVVTPDGRAFGGTFFTLVLRTDDRAIAEFQVVQPRVDRLIVRLVPGPGWSRARKDEIAGRLAGPLRGVSIEIEEVDEIPRLPSGKRRFVVSEVDREDGG